MSIISDYVSIIAEAEGVRPIDVQRDLRPATLTLASANAYGFSSIEEYEDAIREAVYG